MCPLRSTKALHGRINVPVTCKELTLRHHLVLTPGVGGGTRFETRKHYAWTQLTEEIGVQILLGLWNMVKVYTLLLSLSKSACVPVWVGSGHKTNTSLSLSSDIMVTSSCIVHCVGGV